MASLFKTDIQNLNGVGEKTATYLRNLGIYTIGDLINFYPRSYQKWQSPIDFELAIGKKECCVKAKIIDICIPIKTRQGRWLLKIIGEDSGKKLEILYFNSNYMTKRFNIGQQYIFKGTISKEFQKYTIISPQVLNLNNLPCILPVYSQCKGITSNKISSLMKNALSLIPSNSPDTLPKSILDEAGLCSLESAYKNIHFPSDEISLKQARDRIIFEEFFLYYLNMKFIKKISRKPTDIVVSKDFSEEFYQSLPFELTKSQKKIISECMNDMKSDNLSMNRLIEGDVGSGKTVVAAALAYNIVKNGYQVVMMAPTELLAVQHYETFLEFFSKFGIAVEVLHGSLKPKKRKLIESMIAENKVDIVIGTHALISEKTVFSNLGLIITDEQHRFGVKQRGSLVDKGENPHVLVMSATPIPRTLALILYGDLNISVLKDVLPGRQKIDTHKIGSHQREKMFEFLRKQISEGGQIYVVCASIEKGDDDIVDVQSYKDMLLSAGFTHLDVGILHGKMNPNEKSEVMQNFAQNKIKILVSTTVIEVGINVPNANVMVIENAERFGISQLHQLRGRVGRGSRKSYCILVSDSRSKDCAQRLGAMINSNDGFYLSEEDLKIRGPGDFFGVNQHGVPNVKIATNYGDVEIVECARMSAENLMQNEEMLQQPEFRFIRSKVYNFKKENVVSGQFNKNVIF